MTSNKGGVLAPPKLNLEIMDTDVLNTCSASYSRKSDRPHNLSGEVDNTIPPGSLSQSVTEDQLY